MILLFLFCDINIKVNTEKDWHSDIYQSGEVDIGGHAGIALTHWMKSMPVPTPKEIRIDYCWLLLYWLWSHQTILVCKSEKKEKHDLPCYHTNNSLS